jgi:hypothetical protein
MAEYGKEFWEEEAEETRRDLRSASLKLLVLFLSVLTVLGFLLWRSQAAIEFASSHIQGQTDRRYQLTGIVRDAATGKPVPWPLLHDEFDGRVYFQGSGKPDGTFAFATVTTAHKLVVTAFGFRPATVPVGRPWFTWLPAGSESLEVRLQRE